VVSAAAAAGAGDSVFIPPGYGHVTINPSRHYEEMCGGEWVLNVNYLRENHLNEMNPGRKNTVNNKRDIPPLRFLRSDVFNDLPALALRQGSSIYRLAVEGESLLCLGEPERL